MKFLAVMEALTLMSYIIFGPPLGPPPKIFLDLPMYTHKHSLTHTQHSEYTLTRVQKVQDQELPASQPLKGFDIS